LAAGRPKPRKTPNPKTRVRASWPWALILVALIAELFAFTWVREEYRRTGYDISRLTLRNQALLERKDALKIELARLRSPARIAEIAREQLGLKMPEPEQVRAIP
jgi:cell division protein FtsL